MNENEQFEEIAAEERVAASDLVLDLDGFEGPIDVLLTLARQQKVDITRISILKLAEQYLAFIAAARTLQLEIAADYLVMAAWLAYLKSRLLLPEAETGEDEPSGPELAEALTFQLRRLEAMQQAGAKLMARPRFGRDVFGRGQPEGVEIVRTPVYELSLFELLRAYSDNRRRAESHHSLQIAPTELFHTAEIVERMRGLMGDIPDWRSLMSYLPPAPGDGIVARSALASTFGAALELARSGQVEIRQHGRFGPIYVRRAETEPDGAPQ